MTIGVFIYIRILFIVLFAIFDSAFLLGLHDLSTSVRISHRTKLSYFFYSFCFIFSIGFICFLLLSFLFGIFVIPSGESFWSYLFLFLHNSIFPLISTVNFFILLVPSLLILNNYHVFYILKYNSLEKRINKLHKAYEDCMSELILLDNQSPEYVELSALSKSYSQELKKLKFEQIKIKLAIKKN